VTAHSFQVFTIRAGKIARNQEFYEERPALEAVGLAELA
jgi:hypothetical protein